MSHFVTFYVILNMFTVRVILDVGKTIQVSVIVSIGASVVIKETFVGMYV